MRILTNSFGFVSYNLVTNILDEKNECGSFAARVVGHGHRLPEKWSRPGWKEP